MSAAWGQFSRNPVAIVRIFAAAGRALHWAGVPILAICCPAGFAVASLDVVVQPLGLTTWFATAPYPWPEIARALPPVVAAAPVFLLAIAAMPGRHPPVVATLRLALARVPRVAIGGVAASFVVFEFPAALRSFDIGGPSIAIAATVALLLFQLAALGFSYVFLAVLAAEGSGFLRALSRSAQLLRGRWLRMVVVSLLIWILLAASNALALQAASMAISAGRSLWLAFLALSAGASVGIAILLVVFAATYRALCLEKDGPEPQLAAQAFD